MKPVDCENVNLYLSNKFLFHQLVLGHILVLYIIRTFQMEIIKFTL